MALSRGAKKKKPISGIKNVIKSIYHLPGDNLILNYRSMLNNSFIRTKINFKILFLTFIKNQILGTTLFIFKM